MKRHIFDHEKVHPAIREKIAKNHADIVDEVKDAIAKNAVVVVGMATNTNPKRARRLLRSKGIEHAYLEYGSYLSQWRRRNALKMWTGWPTFPMIWIKGTFVGGADDLERLAKSGELDTMLKG
jgi:glutaredoxin-related protein